MKTACCSLVLLLSLTVSTVHSFGIVPFSVSCRVPFSTTTTTTSLQSTSVDSTAAIEAAMAASKEFGATSPEAQAAWEAVEEIRFGADNSEATKAGLDQECAVDDVDEACKEYDTKMAQLSTLLGQYQEQVSELKTLTTDLSNLKLGVNAAVSVDTPALQEKLATALNTAKKMTQEYGIDSTEAKLAWETLEELASSSMEQVMQPSLDQECLVEQAQEACIALEELSKALQLEATAAGAAQVDE